MDPRGLPNRRSWEPNATPKMHSAWLTDCKSSSNALCRTALSNIADKRLEIAAAMRQSMWRCPREELAVPKFLEGMPKETMDKAIHEKLNHVSYIAAETLDLTKSVTPDAPSQDSRHKTCGIHARPKIQRPRKRAGNTSDNGSPSNCRRLHSDAEILGTDI